MGALLYALLVTLAHASAMRNCTLTENTRGRWSNHDSIENSFHIDRQYILCFSSIAVSSICQKSGRCSIMMGNLMAGVLACIGALYLILRSGTHILLKPK